MRAFPSVEERQKSEDAFSICYLPSKVKKTPPRYFWAALGLAFLLAVLFALLISNRLKDILEYFLGS